MNNLLFENLQKNLGYFFTNMDWLQLALTHSSWANEMQLPAFHNERLEFLGDAVLELCISTLLFKRYPKLREGKLTMFRTILVGEKTLAKLARKLELGENLRMAAGEEKQGGRIRDALLCDAMEAVLGAIYLDGGFEKVLKVTENLYENLWPAEDFEGFRPNNKSVLQELCQHRFGKLPEYFMVEATGPEHAREFLMGVRLPDNTEFFAKATSCKKAEQAAASLAIEKLENDEQV